MEKTGRSGLAANEPDALRVSAAEFILEGLYAHRRISRSEEREFSARKSASAETQARREEARQRNQRRQYQG